MFGGAGYVVVVSYPREFVGGGGGAASDVTVFCCNLVCWEEEGSWFSMIDQHCVIFNWNVRDLNNSARRQVVFNSVRDTRATIVALQETKLEHVDRQMVYEILGTRFVDNFVVLPASGTRGGILA
jgi:hypothetical protein